MAFLDNNGVTRLVADLKSKFATLVSGAVAVVQGGTGKTTHTTNAVLTGNGTNAVNNVATADGALYATAANGAATFGTLPVAQGGTDGTTEAEARENLEVPVNAAIATVESTTATANHAIGDHFMLDDKLKTATAAIATGETINATNSADDTVQSQIDALRDSVSTIPLNQATVDGITARAYRTGNVVMVQWSGNVSALWSLNVWKSDILTGLPSPVAGDTWAPFAVIITGESYDVRMSSGGSFNMISRAEIAAGKDVYGVLSYITAS